MQKNITMKNSTFSNLSVNEVRLLLRKKRKKRHTIEAIVWNDGVKKVYFKEKVGINNEEGD
jgi:hypothetical protein